MTADAAKSFGLIDEVVEKKDPKALHIVNDEFETWLQWLIVIEYCIDSF